MLRRNVRLSVFLARLNSINTVPIKCSNMCIELLTNREKIIAVFINTLFLAKYFRKWNIFLLCSFIRTVCITLLNWKLKNKICRFILSLRLNSAIHPEIKSTWSRRSCSTETTSLVLFPFSVLANTYFIECPCVGVRIYGVY